MSDVVAEAVAFYNQTRDEGELDLASALGWSYALGPLRPDQVDAVVAAVGRQGFTRIEAVPQDGDPKLREVRFSEVRAHTLDSFAERVRGLAELAGQHGCELLDWTIEAEPGAGGDEPAAEEEEHGGEPGPPDNAAQGERIVEVCSAANEMEAHALRAVLEDNGIRAEVVGEVLNTTLPVGEAISPRIWVQAKDARRARQIIAQAGVWHPPEPGEWPEDSEQAAGEPPAQQAEAAGDEPEAAGSAFAFLSGALFLAAIAVLFGGAARAWWNWTTLRTHPATADAQCVGLAMPSCNDSYVYLVNGREYHLELPLRGRAPPPQIPVYYDPSSPDDHVVGPLASPAWILVAAVGGAIFLCFLGRQFR
jgi:hypothetical protein